MFLNKFFHRAIAATLLSLASAAPAATTYFVATNGLDSNTGASNSPFATITRAQTNATSGDTVYLRGGTYYLTDANITTTNAPWVIVNNITKSSVSYLAYPGERPVFDFSGVQPPSNRVTAFLVTASDCVFKGFDVVGVKILLTGGNVQAECFRVAGGNRNRFEQLAMHDGMGIGWYLTSGQSNLVLNCDAYRNRGLDSSSLGNIDGFGAHPSSTSGTGNVFRGCRAWFNSDDGYDCINAKALVTFDNCWAFYNGYFTNFASSTGDGNGFKSGGYGVNGSTTPPVPAPRHVTKFCLSVRNRSSGFYANHHTGGLDWFNNTAHSNSVNFNMLCNLDATTNINDVAGFDHVMKNNLGFKARSTEVSNLGASNDVTFNYFTLPVTVTNNDFVTLNEALLTLPRKANGDLPYIGFAQLVGTSDLVNAGTNVGYAFAGDAPDLGVFEYASQPAPTITLTGADTNLIFTGTGGWAGGPWHLVATTNIALPMAAWSVIATNQFDLSGNYTTTNTIPVGFEQRFYRAKLP